MNSLRHSLSGAPVALGDSSADAGQGREEMQVGRQQGSLAQPLTSPRDAFLSLNHVAWKMGRCQVSYRVRRAAGTQETKRGVPPGPSYVALPHRASSSAWPTGLQHQELPGQVGPSVWGGNKAPGRQQLLFLVPPTPPGRAS